MATVGSYGLDYAWQKPHPDVAWAEGYRFVSRYLSWLPNGKVLTSAERQALHARGFDVQLNWEYTANDQTRGAAGGTKDATEAVRQAKLLGAPPGTAIYFSCDFDVQESQLATVRAYWAAAHQVCAAAGYPIGVYGGYRAVQNALAAGYRGWQTYAWSIWADADGVRRRHWVDGGHVRQIQNGIIVDGANCDKNQLMRGDSGAWHPGTTTSTTIAQKLKRLAGVQTNALGERIIAFVERNYPAAAQAGMYVTSALRPTDTDSHHSGTLIYGGSPTAAADFGAYQDPAPDSVDQADMGLLADWLYTNFWDLTVELIHTQPNDHLTYVKNQTKVGPYAAADHINHVHFATSALLLDKMEARASAMGMGETDMALKDDLDGWYLMHRVLGLQAMADPIVIPLHPGTNTPERKEPNKLAQAIRAGATVTALTPKLDAILAAAEDDGDTTVVLAPEALAELTKISDAIAALPADVEARVDRQLDQAAHPDAD